MPKAKKKPKGRWPNGYASFVKKVQANAELLLTGRFVAIDPASGGTSMPGYSVYQATQRVEGGVLQVNSALSPELRLAELYDLMAEAFKDVDLVVIEELKGSMVRPTLHWSVGVAVTAIRKPYIQVPINYWKALAKETEGYEKADDADADMIGQTVIELAREKQKLIC